MTGLNEGSLPEQIVSNMYSNINQYVSRYLIYEYISYNRYELKGKLYMQLRNRGVPRRKCKSAIKVKIPNRVGIEQRPEIAAKGIEYGHFEGDTIVSKDHNSCVVTITEKKTLQEFIIPVMKMDATNVANAIITRLSQLDLPVKTLTVDNGFEFYKHELIAQILCCDVYFAKPFCSTDKAQVEYQNGLIRDFVPKGSDFRFIEREYWAEIENNLNTRPRKKFGWKTPNQMVALEGRNGCT